MLQFLDQGKQLVHQPVLGTFFSRSPFSEQEAFADAARDPAVGGRRLPRPVDGTAHHRHRDGLVHPLQPLLHLGSQADQIDAGPPQVGQETSSAPPAGPRRPSGMSRAA